MNTFRPVKLKALDSLVLIGVILVVFTALTWIIPAGQFERAELNGRVVVVPGTYQPVEASPQTPADLLMAPIKGFVGAAEIIAFILLVGGAFGMVNATGAIDAGLQAAVRRAAQNPAVKRTLVPMLVVLFSLAGGTFGMSEEVLIFVLLTIPLSVALGYDRLLGICIPFLGAAVGFAGAALNPFTVGIAQGIAELPMFSGAGYRWLIWSVMTLVTVAFVVRYMARLDRTIKAGKRMKYEATEQDRVARETLPLTRSRSTVLVLFAISILVIMVGSMRWQWYIGEICAVFIALGVLSAALGKVGWVPAANAFRQGSSDLLASALVVGMARAILVIAEDGLIIDTVLHALSGAIGDMPDYLAVQVMLGVQCIINVFIPSGSGQAAVTMPIMTPLADLLQISRQTAVLAFQFGDGLINLIIPTSGITMGILGIGRIPFTEWLRFIAPLMAWLLGLAMVFLALAEVLGVW